MDRSLRVLPPAIRKWDGQGEPANAQELIALVERQVAAEELFRAPVAGTLWNPELLAPQARRPDLELCNELGHIATQCPNTDKPMEYGLKELDWEYNRTTAIYHDIVTPPGVTVKVKPYHIPEAKKKEIAAEVKRMLDLGVIEESYSEWSCPIVLVLKPSRTWRFCNNFRKLNEVPKFDAYPMLHVEELIEKLGKTNYLTTLDLTKGYWQVPLTESAKENTAFSTLEGLFQYTVLPFELHGAPATFQRLMDKVLKPHAQYASAYIDDVVIHSPDWETHLQKVEAVLDSLREFGLTANSDKCPIGLAEAKYLGYTVGGSLVHPQVNKVEAFKTWPQPVNKKQVQTFLGIVGYLRRFIPNFATWATLLTDLIKARAPTVYSNQLLKMVERTGDLAPLDLEIRLAREEDFEEVVAMSSGIFDGMDYLPAKYHSWLQEHNRFVLLGKKGGKVVALESAFIIDDGETAVLEGLRVAPWERGKGIAKVIQRHCTDFLKNHYPGVKILRGMTAEGSFSQKTISDLCLLCTRVALYLRFKTEDIQKVIEGLMMKLIQSEEYYKPVTLQADQVRRIYLDSKVIESLLPAKTIIQNWQPLKPLNTNLNILLDRGSTWLADSIDNPTFLSLDAYPHRVPLEEGYRFNIDLFGKNLTGAKNLFLGHIQSLPKSLNAVVFCLVHFDPSLKEGMVEFYEKIPGLERFNVCLEQLLLEEEISGYGQVIEVSTVSSLEKTGLTVTVSTVDRSVKFWMSPMELDNGISEFGSNRRIG
nr:PREDICTED: uncharacterized protein LOC102352713 [Latimeria chalumnae]|eukprot:XP_014351258.1 PREDICTED: uncharacterized protein LOC102352713 [Latimeria chalumnae]